LTARQPPSIRVLIIAGIRLYSEGLAKVLDGRARVEVVGVASDPIKGLRWDRHPHPDIVLVDTSMPQAVVAVQAILGAAPTAKVIALAVSEDNQDALAFAEAGVSGYVTRDAALDDLVAAIESVAGGGVPCPPRLTAVLLRHIRVLAAWRPATPGGRPLTPRELEIVRLIDLGLTNKEIARRLCIEVATVKNHVHRILDKLHVDRRAEAAAWVRAKGPPGGLEIPASPAVVSRMGMKGGRTQARDDSC
jgi:two-component system nitrate/nitrite response regulator NarL